MKRFMQQASALADAFLHYSTAQFDEKFPLERADVLQWIYISRNEQIHVNGEAEQILASIIIKVCMK